MANYTENLELTKPEQSDRFLITGYNGNMDIIDTAHGELSDTVAGITAQLGGLTFITLTQTEYDALETPDPDTVYIITEEETGS